MHRLITIMLDNPLQNQEQIDITAEKVLGRIQESIFDHPEIEVSRLASPEGDGIRYDLITSTTLPDSDWLDPLP